MKNGSFKGLLCREFYLIKPGIPAMLISSLSMTCLSVLVVLSFRFGNLTKIEELRFEDFAEGLKLFPVLGSAMISLTGADAAFHDISPLWERFRKTTPVSCMRLALAKYTIMVISFAISSVLTFITLFLMCGILDMPVTAGDTGITLAIISFCILYAVVAQLMVTYFRSIDKGMLATMGVLMGVIIILFAVTDSFSTTGRDAEEISAFLLEIKNTCAEIIPIMVLMIIVLICGGFCVTAMLYKRREK